MTTENIERIATALERIADAQERAHPKFNPGGYLNPSWLADGDELMAPFGGGERVVTSDEIRRATECDDRTCTERGHWAPKPMRTVALRGPNQCEPGCGRPSLHGGDCDAVGVSTARVPWDGCESWVGDARPKLIVSTASDPLDEGDHRPRHFVDGGGDVIGTHLYRHGNRHWHSYPVEYLPCNQGCRLALTKWADIPLTFCDCDPTDSDRATD